jgi:carboxyl-terminal processing protease
MPLRNLVLIAAAALLSLVCYEQADHNRYSSTITEIMSAVESRYVKPVERRELFEHAMQGMISGLDPYSGYMTAEEYRPFIESIEQKFGGVGILVEVNPETKRLTVMSPLFGTPAYKAGIKSGDTIVSIDGHDTEGLDLPDAVKLMKGDPDTQVALGIRHAGEEEEVVMKLTRAIIQTESVLGDRRIEGARWDFHLQEDPRIANIRIENFGDKTAEEVRKALTDDEGNYAGYEALIIDLRGNPGGTLNAAVEICDMFLDSGVIVTTKERDDRNIDARGATTGVLVPDSVPVAVLVNHYSASASEIVAAALQDYQRATIIGQRSWGKGSVQNVIEIDDGKSGALRLTTASYWRPSNVNIHRDPKAKDTDTWGVLPNEGFEVKLTDEELKKALEARAAKDAYRPHNEKKPAAEKPGEEGAAPAAAFEDPQLRKAIDFLKEKMDPKAMSPAKA